MEYVTELRAMGSRLTELRDVRTSGEEYSNLYERFLALYLEAEAWKDQVIVASKAEKLNSRSHYSTFESTPHGHRPRHYYAYNGRWRWLQVGDKWRQERLFGGKWKNPGPELVQVEAPYYVKLHLVGKGHDDWREAWLDDRRLGIWVPPGPES